jgi:3-methylcrotonyl-CoA carboxylase alpha subunit
MIRSLLVANRGEIACRIIRTARAMGIRTVAVHSDADARALHVREADEAVPIGPSPAAESYLRGETIIAAAKQTGAEAIHPGYGFLSENAGFAEAVAAAGLIWVGPEAREHPRDGPQGRRQEADAGRRRAGDPRLPGRGPVARTPARRSRDDRLAGADQGRRGRRRQGHAQGR